MKAEPKKPSEPIAETAALYDLEIEAYLKAAVAIEPMAIEEEFVRVPSDIAYWNERYCVALREYLESKTERERIEGELICDAGFVSEVELQVGKRPTVDQIKGAIKNDDRYVSAKVREMAADTERTRLRGCLDALTSKRDMLVSLGAQIRIEMAQDPLIRGNMARLRQGEDIG